MNKIYRTTGGEIHYKLFRKMLIPVICSHSCSCSSASLISDEYPFSASFVVLEDFDIDYIHGWKLMNEQSVRCYFKTLSDMEKFGVLVMLS